MFAIAAFFGLFSLAVLLLAAVSILRVLGIGVLAALIVLCAALGVGAAVVGAVLSGGVAVRADH